MMMLLPGGLTHVWFRAVVPVVGFDPPVNHHSSPVLFGADIPPIGHILFAPNHYKRIAASTAIKTSIARPASSTPATYIPGEAILSPKPP